MSGFNRMVTLNGFEVSETAYSQAALVTLPLIHHSVNMPSETFSRL